MIKYDVASATMVLNKSDNRKAAPPAYANQRIRRNAEMSDTISRERLAMVTNKATHRIGYQSREERAEKCKMQKRCTL
jgi:hypothetical protein